MVIAPSARSAHLRALAQAHLNEGHPEEAAGLLLEALSSQPAAQDRAPAATDIELSCSQTMLKAFEAAGDESKCPDPFGCHGKMAAPVDGDVEDAAEPEGRTQLAAPAGDAHGNDTSGDSAPPSAPAPAAAPAAAGSSGTATASATDVAARLREYARS